MSKISSFQLSHLLSLPVGVRSLVVNRAILLQTAARSGRRPFATTHHVRHAEARPNSVSDSEISHFNALASSWWDPHGSSRLLHLMNPLRHKFISRCLGSSDAYIENEKKARYLDIGCGGGIFAESAARLPNTQSVTAIDPSPEVIAVAKRHQRLDPLLLEPGRLEYRNIAIEDLTTPAVPDQGYNIVSLFEVIEHIRAPSSFLQTCIQHLRPGSWLVGSTIARTNASWFTTKLMAEDVLRLVPRGTHDWSQYILPGELRDWARSQPELDVDGDGWQIMGVVYVPGLGWREVRGSEEWGNYFFAMRRRL